MESTAFESEGKQKRKKKKKKKKEEKFEQPEGSSEKASPESSLGDSVERTYHEFLLYIEAARLDVSKEASYRSMAAALRREPAGLGSNWELWAQLAGCVDAAAGRPCEDSDGDD